MVTQYPATVNSSSVGSVVIAREPIPQWEGPIEMILNYYYWGA